MLIFCAQAKLSWELLEQYCCVCHFSLEAQTQHFFVLGDLILEGVCFSFLSRVRLGCSTFGRSDSITLKYKLYRDIYFIEQKYIENKLLPLSLCKNSI